MLKFVGTALTAAALIVGAAHAESNMIRKDVEVSYRDLNLSTDAGARTLLVRIQAAAASACGGAAAFYSSYSVAPSLAAEEFATCRANAVNAAVNAIPAPLVHQIFASNGSYERVAGAR
ncbi:MAG: UrcA family protein [Rhizomicrobium sp.]|nr:UrcA family protein [Rhizomicrobium sp.]